MSQYKTCLSLRLDAAFRDVAAGVVDVPNPAQLRALAHPDKRRPVSVHLSSRVSHPLGLAADYKPTPGGYPSAGARA